jgi:hypothetical protein
VRANIDYRSLKAGVVHRWHGEKHLTDKVVFDALGGFSYLILPYGTSVEYKLTRRDCEAGRFIPGKVFLYIERLYAIL